MARRSAVFLFCFLCFKMLFAADITTVSLQLLAMQQGESSVIDAEIACVADGCSAFDITIAFEPHVIQVDQIEVGPFLGDLVFTAEQTIDNEAGIVQLAATSLGDPPLAEESVLLRLTVTALNPGASKLRIMRLDVGDMIGNSLETLGVDGGVVVTEAADDTLEAGPKPQTVIEEETAAEPESSALQEATAEPEVPADSAESQRVTCQYTIRPGDTLSGIAIANHVTVSQLSELNHITDPRRLVVGQELLVPASECRAAVTSSQIVDVFDCHHLGNNVFEWYSARSIFDASGNPISYTRIGGPYTGEWRPGCPAGERPPSPSHRSSQGSSSQSQGSNGNSGGDTSPPPPADGSDGSIDYGGCPGCGGWN